MFLGKPLKAPLLINAMTGGYPGARKINGSLAGVARILGIAMAVGSQTAGLEDPGLKDTYAIAREVNPEGVLLANLSAGAPPEHAAAAVKMISADGLQLYLNVAQELAMSEGERDFRGVMENIREVISSVSVPVIVKEVGCGLSRETAAAIADLGVRHIDTGGQGGTNFIAIEQMRTGRTETDGIRNWGIPAAVSLLEVLSLGSGIFVIASGGISSGVDIARALSLGAGMAGMARPLLKALVEGSEGVLCSFVRGIIEELRLSMLLTGAVDLAQLREKSVIITGKTAEWMERRGIDINCYARR